MDRRYKIQIQVLYLKNHTKYLYFSRKVSFEQKIPKSWFSDPDTEPKIAADPGSTEP